MDILNAKPFQIIVIAVFAVLGLVGLYLFATFNGMVGGKTPIGAVEIWGTVSADPVNDALGELKSFDKRYGDITYVQKSEATFGIDLAEAIAAGEGPDMLLISQEEILSQRNKLDVIPFESIDERTYRDSFLPITELYLTSNGTYGLPIVVDPLVLYYNRPLMATNGVAEAPRTWEAVTGLATRFTERTQDGGIARSLIGFGEYGNVTNARAIISLFLLQSGSNISEYTTSGLRSTLNQGGGSGTSVASAINFYTQFADPAKTLYSWNRSMPESRQAFLSGDVALYVGFASELPELKAANPNLDFDMARIPQPGTVQVRTNYALAYAFAVPKASGNKSGAFAAASELVLNGYGKDLARALYMAPAQRSLLQAATDDKYGAVFYPEALIAKGWLSPSPKETDAIFGTMIGNITTGRMDVQSALSTADQSLNEAL
ncbi:ABC transporter substrate-binding protein [Patescibacteria group bacterium]|nr:ABC transporter substrate-binding protein [Patescibacteria group bacterium]MBU1754970.1 ABC transporter substrate-binding protein [Patescibacteria group bacterium]